MVLRTDSSNRGRKNALTRAARIILRDRRSCDRDDPASWVLESNPSRLDRGGSSCRRDRDGGIDGLVADWRDAVILFDGTLRVDASQRIDGFVADRTTLALGVCDRRVIVPGVHCGPGSTSSAKNAPLLDFA